MRISARLFDKDYDPSSINCDVYLNGEKLNKCFFADEERGEARVYEEDEVGSYVLADGYLKEVKLYGDVEVRMKWTK